MNYICQKCGAEVSEDALFCSKCGEKVSALRCPKCGRRLPEDSAFCTFCGAKITIRDEPIQEQISKETYQIIETNSDSLPVNKGKESNRAPSSDDNPISIAATTTGISNENATSQSEKMAIENAEPQSDIFQKIKDSVLAGKENTSEYYELLKKEKSAYFWFKMLVLLVFVYVNFFIYYSLGNLGIGQKFIILLISSLIVCIPYALICSKIEKKTGIKVSPSLTSIFSGKDTSAEEKESEAGLDHLLHCLEERHPKMLRKLIIPSFLAIIISVIYFAICFSAGLGLWKTFYLTLNLYFEIVAIIIAVWTFKWAVILLLVPIGLILALFARDSLDAEIFPPHSTEYSSNSESFQTTPPADSTCVTITGAAIDEDSERPTIIVSYSWTNTTDTETSAIYNVAIHAYQNSIELEKAYFTDANDEMQMRNIKPGVTVKLEEAFYLDDLKSDILVEATPWIPINGEIYTSTVYTQNRATDLGIDISEPSAYGISVSDFIGEYSYDGSFETPDGTWANFYYALSIEDANNGVAITEIWRGVYTFCNDWASQDDLEGNTLYFVVKYGENAGTHSLTYIPAVQSPYGADTIYIDGNTDMPYTRESYSTDSSYDSDNSYNTDEYILPTDTQYITESDLYGMSKERVSLARNEIYARYGYSFQNAEIRNYFQHQSWYYENSNINANTFGINNLSDCERANLKTIQQYERDMGWK